MERSIRWAWLVFLTVITMTALPPAWGANPAASAAATQTVNAGYLENVAFEKQPGKERVILTVSKQSEVTVENQPGNAVAVRLENLFVPEGLRRSLEDPSLANVVRVTPVQKTADGRSWVLMTIDLRRKVPYSVRSEGMNVLIDFNVTSLASAAAPAPEKPLLPMRPPAVRQEPLTKAPAIPAKEEEDTDEERKVYTGSRIFLDVQDADIIKVVFRLLAEQGNVNIVAGDDVKGMVTLTVKNVPWDQALDTVLTMKGLGKKRKGNVITVMTLEKIKKDEADRLVAQEAKRKAEMERLRPTPEPFITKVVKIDYANAQKLTANILDLLPKDIDKDGKVLNVQGSVKMDEHSNSLIIKATKQEITRLLPIIAMLDESTDQIEIKANIVETTKEFARSLGVKWGGVFGGKLGNQNMYVTPGGAGGSTTPPGSVLSGGYTPAYSGNPGISGQGFGVNFPAPLITQAFGPPASLGLIFGSIGGNVLELQLSALQRDNKLKILSSPSLTTLDNQKASTENGMEVPVTIVDKDGQSSTSYKLATLKLEITPHVIDGKTLKMSIIVQKDEVSTLRDAYGNPYIIKKVTNTSLVVQDGETIVISGLTKQNLEGGDTGVPLFKDIPILGWLFKSELQSSSMEEVLIFITPTIMKPLRVSGIQTGPWKP